MDSSWRWRVGIIVAVTLGSIWFLIPTYYSFFVLPKAERNNIKALDTRLPKWAPPARYRLSLGLDLQGGIHMVMRVDTKTALQKRTERAAMQIVNHLKEKNLGEVTPTTNPERLELTLTAPIRPRWTPSRRTSSRPSRSSPRWGARAGSWCSRSGRT